MPSIISRSALGALNSHRFLLRAAFAATTIFAWVFALQYLYALFGSLTEAFVRVIMLYQLAQVITVLLTPYSAIRLVHGVKRRMIAGVLAAVLALLFLSLALVEFLQPMIGMVAFAVFLGVYRALYWTPYMVEKERTNPSTHVSQEIFIALMPAIAGFALLQGTLGAAILLCAGASILIASLAPLARVPEIHERYAWGYRETFGELFETKYNPIIEAGFLEGLQGAALLLLWPMAVFVLVGFSYQFLGLVLAATLLLSILIRPRAQRILHRRVLLHATLAASSWVLRLVVASPIGVILVDAYAAVDGRKSADPLALDQAADNGTYIDEYTVLKEIAQCFGRITMCIVAAVCISILSLPVGLAIAFCLAGAAAAVAVIHSKQNQTG
jgi:hypothetical protein